jgi:hypothetical protein
MLCWREWGCDDGQLALMIWSTMMMDKMKEMPRHVTPTYRVQLQVLFRALTWHLLSLAHVQAMSDNAAFPKVDMYEINPGLDL